MRKFVGIAAIVLLGVMIFGGRLGLPLWLWLVVFLIAVVLIVVDKRMGPSA